MNVLIVEDNPIDQIKLRNAVERLNFKVAQITTSVAETTMCFTSAIQFDFLICDISLSDGVIFEIDNWPDIPTLFVTAFEDKEFLDNSIKVRKSWFIIKPFSDLILTSAIIKLLENFAKPKDLYITVFGKHKNPIQLPLNEIVYLESEGNYSTIVTNNNSKYAIKRSAKLLVEEGIADFLRVRRATFINKSKITKVSIAENKIYAGDYSFNFTKEFKKNIYEYHHLDK